MAWATWNAGNNGYATSYTATSNAAWEGWNNDTSGSLYTNSAEGPTWAYWNSTTYTVTSDATNASTYDLEWFAWNVREAQREMKQMYKQVVFECDENGLLKKTKHRRQKRYEAVKRRREEKQRRKRLVRVAMEARRREEAEKKAAQLLIDVLGLEQYEVYKRTGRILIHGNKHDWIVHQSGMVQRFEKHKVIDLCVSLAERWRYPKDDNIVAMALTAKLNEDELISKANKIRERKKEKLDECAVLELVV